MSGHSEDPVAEESKRFFTFFNLSMLLVAITGIESRHHLCASLLTASMSIIGVLIHMLLRDQVLWRGHGLVHASDDGIKSLNTVLFLMGLVIARWSPFFAVIYML